MTSSTTSPVFRRWYGWAAALILLSFLVIAGTALREATDPAWQDTEGYLGHGLYVQEHGGLWGWLRDSFHGRFPISERHPLYLLMIAPGAARTADYFFSAKLINLGTGLAVLASLLWMVRRRCGPGPALLAGSLYAVSQSLVIPSAHVANEPVFVLCTLWSWWWLTGAPTRRGWLLAGMAAGLALLAKSPAMLMIIAAGLAFGWQHRQRVLTTPALWGFLAAVLVTASPWLVNNLRLYGRPLYEGVNTQIMWLDRWSELGDPASVMYRDAYGIKTIERNALPDMHRYLAAHTPRQILARLARGYYQQTTVVAPEALRPAAGWLQPFGVWAGGAVLLCGLIGWWQKRRTFEGILVGLWTLAFLTFFGWNGQLFPDVRYLAPLIPIWVAYAAVVLWAVVQHGRRLAQAARVALVISVLTVGTGALWLVVTGRATAAHPRLGASPAYERLMRWLNTQRPQGASLMPGPTAEFYGLFWMAELPLRIYQTPAVRTREAWLQYLADRHIDTLIIHPENLRGLEGMLGAELLPHWFEAADGSIQVREPLPGWVLAYRDPGTPSRFLVYHPAPEGS